MQTTDFDLYRTDDDRDSAREAAVEVPTIPCLSLWQPWGTLVEIGAKQCETRSWETMYRGPLAIHIAKKWTRELERLCFAHHFLRALRQNESNAEHRMIERLKAARGHIVAVVNLTKCERIDALTTPLDYREVAFGDYTTGRFRWDLDDVRRLPEPVPYKGHQGLFRVPAVMVGL